MKPLTPHRLLFCGLLAVSTIVLVCRAPHQYKRRFKRGSLSRDTLQFKIEGDSMVITAGGMKIS